MSKPARIFMAGAVLCTALSAANFDIAVSGSEKGISGLSLSIGDYYRIPHSEIVVIERAIPRDEMSVVYLLSRRAHRDAQFIVDLRMRGYSWWDITLRLGLDPYTLYVVDSHRHSGPPYGRAYGYYKEGKHHRLRDDEIVELSNIRFLSKYHRVSVDEIIDRRREGGHYGDIDDHFRSKRFDRQERDEHRYYEKRGDERKTYDKRDERKFNDRGGPDRGNKFEERK